MGTGNPVGIRTGPKCGAKAKSGNPCRSPAGYRTDHPGRGPCVVHRGNTPSMRAKYARERVADEVAKWQESNGFPAAVDSVVSGPEVLLRSLARAEATVLWIRSRIALWNLPVMAAREPGERVDDGECGDTTGLYSLTQYREGENSGTIGESERAAWLRTLFEWEQFTAKTAAKVSQLGIQEQALRMLASQAPTIESVLLLAAAKVGLDLDVAVVRSAVGEAVREVAPAARPASLRDVQGYGILTA